MPTALGWVGEDIVDAAEDVATSVIDRVGGAVKSLADAQKILGVVLGYVAPIVAQWPGIGTAVSVALSAASAVALGTPIDEAILQTASNAVPGGLPRIGFNSAVAISKDLVAGREPWESVIDTCRSAAGQAGGDRAVQAFDQGLALARGQKVSDGTIALGRAQLASSGTTEALAAYDAGVAVARGEGADGALFAAARDYIAANGGPLALASFDAGLALAHGKGLQDAGFAAFKVFVSGNDSAERALVFAEKMIRAAREGKDLRAVLIADLSAELAPFLGQLSAAQLLGPLLDAMHVDPSALAWGSQALADAWGYAEPVVRAAQAVMRTGEEDASTLSDLTPKTIVTSIGKKGVSAADTAAEAARWAAVVAANPGVPEICLRAEDAKARNSPAYASLAQQCAALPPSPRPLSAAKSSVATKAALAQVIIVPKTLAVPFQPARLAAATTTAKAPSSRSSVGEDVALGGVVGLAALALLWWSRG